MELWKRAALAALLATATLALDGVTAQTPAPASPGAADELYAVIRGDDLGALDARLAAGADVNVKDRRGVTPLMMAATAGSLGAMVRLVSKGADVNAASIGGATALMWAATDAAKVRLLLEHRADVNAVSASGRSALFIAAMSDSSADIARLLIARGADARLVEKTGMTVLHAATVGNDADTIRQILEAGVDVHATDVRGFTALMNAAAGKNVAAVKMLLARGAHVNAVSAPPGFKVKNGIIALGQFTPLLIAAPYGPLELVRALIAAGANVNVKDARGLTPLMLAVATDHADEGIVRALLAAGADPGATSLDGETALDWALKAGPTPIAARLRRGGAPGRLADGPPIAGPAPTTMKPAVERSVALLETSTRSFFVNGACGACHAQNVTDIAIGVARAKGIRTNAEDANARRNALAAAFAATGPMLLERFDGPTVDILLYTLAGFASVAHPPDRTTDAMVANIVAQQSQNGGWVQGGIARPPIEDGDVFRTALAVRAMAQYGPPGRAPEMQARISRAVEWLQAQAPRAADERNFRLMGLRWGGRAPGALDRAAREVLRAQRPDGGWAQRAELASDPYATGQTLFALQEIGQPTTSEAYRRGVQYLLSTQRADGSWYVRSRAPKFQPYFEGGFPYGHDQWISAMATGWATGALAASLPAAAGTPTVH